MEITFAKVSACVFKLSLLPSLTLIHWLEALWVRLFVSGTIYQDIRHPDHCPYPFKKAGVYGNVTKTKSVNERRARGKGRC